MFAQNIDFGYTLEPPQSMFWSKNKKLGIPLQTPDLFYKDGVKVGMNFKDMFS